MTTASTKATLQEKIRYQLIRLGQTPRGDVYEYREQLARLARLLIPVAGVLNAQAADLFDPATEISLQLPDPLGQDQAQFCQLWRERKIPEAYEAVAQIKTRARAYLGGTLAPEDRLSLTDPQWHTVFAVHFMTSVDPRLSTEYGNVFTESCVVPICLAMNEIMTARRLAEGKEVIKVVAEGIVHFLDRWLSMATLL